MFDNYPENLLVIFGATGDLCKKKLIPSLYQLHQKGLLDDDLLIMGASRRDITREEWLSSLGSYPDEFVERLVWQRADLSDVVSLNHIPIAKKATYFLSVPPETYEDAINNLQEAQLINDPENQRVIIEKPFGTDLQSANSLQSVVDGCLREKQVYRIDHYLGKDTVNNILATRMLITQKLLKP